MTDKISRHLLPQIPSEKLGEFVAYLERNGVEHEVCHKPVSGLRAIQKHVNREKVDSLKNDTAALKKPIVISKGGWILDGHHRWIALKELDSNAEIPCILCLCDINKLIALGHKFEHSFRVSVEESTIYSRQLWKEMKKCRDEEESGRLMVRKTLRPY
jgi:hypothetical protein